MECTLNWKIPRKCIIINTGDELQKNKTNIPTLIDQTLNADNVAHSTSHTICVTHFSFYINL